MSDGPHILKRPGRGRLPTVQAGVCSPRPGRGGRGFLDGRSLARLCLLLTLALSRPGLLPAASTNDPVRIHVFRVQNGLFHLEWTGGRPPYRLQAKRPEDSDWFEFSAILRTNRYDGLLLQGQALFRVLSEPDLIAPSPPPALSFRASICDRVALSWLPAEDDERGLGIMSYTLYRDGVRAMELPATTTFALDTGLEAQRGYSYWITATDLAGNESAPSASVLASTPECPPVESNTNGVSPPASVTVEWDRVSEETDLAGYVVSWGRQPGFYEGQMDVNMDTRATLSELQHGTVYFIQVQSYDIFGVLSLPSTEVAHIPP